MSFLTLCPDPEEHKVDCSTFTESMNPSGKDENKPPDSGVIQEYFKYTRQTGRRQRVESVQVLVATGILGWYITNYSISTIPCETPARYFAAFAGISGIFLVLKINFLTLQYSLRNDKLIKLNELILPFLYFISFNSVVILVLIQMGVPENLRQEVIFVLLFFIVIIAIFYAKKNYETSRNIREIQRHLQYRGETTSKKELMRIVESNPQIVESSYKIKEKDTAYRVEGYRFNMDFVGVTDQDEKVGIKVTKEINSDTITNIKYIADLINGSNLDRFIVVTSNVTEEVVDELDELSINYKLI